MSASSFLEPLKATVDTQTTVRPAVYEPMQTLIRLVFTGDGVGVVVGVVRTLST